MNRLGLNKGNTFSIGLDNCIRNTKYRKINLIKSNENKKFNNNFNKKDDIKCKNKEKNNKEKNNKEKNNKEIDKLIVKRRKRKKKLIVVLTLLAIVVLVFEIFTTLIEPSLIAMCEIRANSIGVSVSNKAVNK